MSKEFVEKIAAYIQAEQLISAGDRVLVGLSGGADSVGMLFVLHTLCERFSFTLGAFHVNHGIRGAEADRDEAFVRALCRRLEVPLFVEHADVPAISARLQMGLEEAGRQVRYDTAHRICAEQGYDKIALAHQEKDVAETFLFHLFRGSSITGLGSIAPKREQVIRPILCCGREEIEEYLAEIGESYCVDSTNLSCDYSRNRIRHQILEYAQQEINAQAVSHVARAAAELRQLEDYLQAETDEICAKAIAQDTELLLAPEYLAGKPRILQRKAIHRLLCDYAGSAKDLTAEHVESILALCGKQSGKQVHLPYGVTVSNHFGTLVFSKKTGPQARTGQPMEIEISVPGEYPCDALRGTLIFRLIPNGKNVQIPKNEYTKWFDYGKIKGTLRLRCKRPGDRIGLLDGSKSLKSVFTENKIDKETRDRMLVLADDAQVLWIPGVRVCDNYRVCEDTEYILEVQKCCVN